MQVLIMKTQRRYGRYSAGVLSQEVRLHEIQITTPIRKARPCVAESPPHPRPHRRASSQPREISFLQSKAPTPHVINAGGSEVANERKCALIWLRIKKN